MGPCIVNVLPEVWRRQYGKEFREYAAVDIFGNLCDVLKKVEY